jgi:ferredoxin-nitrite reductase
MNTVERWKQDKHPLAVVEDVKEHANEGLSFDEIEARAGDGEWERLKWAGMYSHGKQRGYFMVRTKVPGGFLTPAQAETIGEVAEEFATAPEAHGGHSRTISGAMRSSISRPARTFRCTGSRSRTSRRSGHGTTTSG